MNRRILSIILAVCLILSMLPADVLAVDAGVPACSEECLAQLNEYGMMPTTAELALAQEAASVYYPGSSTFRQSRYDALVCMALAAADTFHTRKADIEMLLGGEVDGTSAANLIASFSDCSDLEMSKYMAWVAKLFLYGDYDGNFAGYSEHFVAIAFDANGGWVDTAAQLVRGYSACGTLPTAENGDLTFAGWYTEPEGGQRITEDTVAVEDMTLYAHWSVAGVPMSDTYSLQTKASEMEASQNLIDFIKASEGFSKYAIWDYSQWSIGYGSRCDPDDYPDGITEEEAEALLRTYVDAWVVVVNEFIDRHELTKNQHEFDALVCFCYGVGNAWMYEDYNITRYTIEGCTELQFLNCIGSWVSAGGQTLNGLIYRRMREANIYCNGDYSRTDNLYNDVPYGCVTFNANGGSVSTPRIYTIRGLSYRAYDAFPEPTREGYYFAGWFDEDGEQYTSDTICTTVRTPLTAKWSTSADDYFNEDGNEPPAPPPVETVAGFTDVTVNDWFAEYVEQAVEDGLFTGVTETLFKPQNTMTRAMFVQVIYRMYGEPEVTGTLPFTDVPANAWYYDALLWAYENEIVNGVSADRFAPNADVTRQQMAKMLFHYCSLCGNADLESLQPLDAFADAGSVAEYAKIPMQWAVGNGIITGVTSTTLAPEKNTTRAQAATMLVRYCDTFNSGVSAAAVD